MGYHPPVLDVIYFPTTVVIIIINCYICYYLNHNNVPVETVAISPNTFLDRREYWRALTAAFSHYSLLHLIFNVSSSWALRTLETMTGFITYLRLIMILIIVPPIIDSLIRKRFWPDRNVLAVGYSCVLCGLSAYATLLTSNIDIFGYQIPMSLMPFFNVLITQLLIPQASLIGHLSGVFAGFAIRWHLFDWFTNQVFLESLPWIIFLFFFSYVRGHRDDIRWFQYSTDRRNRP